MLAEVGGVGMTGVLDGVVVLDLTTGISGPLAGMLLADHGAQVTKIEPPGRRSFRASSAVPRCGSGASGARPSTSTTPATATGSSRSRRTPTCCSRAWPRASPTSSASTTTAARGATRGSSTARSPGTARRGARRPPRVRRAGRGAHRAAVREPRRPGRHDRPPVRDPTRFPDLRGARRLLGRRAAAGPAVLRRAVGEPRHALQRHPRDQRRAPRARGHRAGPARAHVAAPGRARHHAVGRGSASSTPTPRASRPGSSTRARRRASSAAPTAAGPTTGCRCRASS